MNQINIIYALDKFILNYQIKDEDLIFITTSFLLNLIKESNVLFFDGAFRSCPSSYYQIFFIIGHIKAKKISLLVLSVLMRYKNVISYVNLIKYLKLMLDEYNINIDSSKLYMMTNFEKYLLKALKKSFQIV